MRSLSMLMNLVHDLERLSMAASPFYTRPASSIFYRWPTWSELGIPPQRYAVEGAERHNGKDDFKLSLDVAQFKPEELKVKVVDNCVVVEGKQEQSDGDKSYFSQHFVRRFSLPRNYEPDKIISTLSPDGVLTVSVPKPPAIEDDAANERVIQIQQTGRDEPSTAEGKQESIESSGAKK